MKEVIPMSEWKNCSRSWVLMPTTGNTVIAPPRMLIAFLENNLQKDGTVRIPTVLRPYMGGAETLEAK